MSSSLRARKTSGACLFVPFRAFSLGSALLCFALLASSWTLEEGFLFLIGRPKAEPKEGPTDQEERTKATLVAPVLWPNCSPAKQAADKLRHRLEAKRRQKEQPQWNRSAQRSTQIRDKPDLFASWWCSQIAKQNSRIAKQKWRMEKPKSPSRKVGSTQSALWKRAQPKLGLS